jgi:hypothetical protein
MGFMDKAKEAALQAKAQAQQIAQQGQAKVATIQQGRGEAELFRTLGEAVYNEQRRGGDREAVTAALNALDQHYAVAAATPASTGEPAAPATPPAGADAAPGTPAAPAAPGAPAEAPPGGSFTLDNL